MTELTKALVETALFNEQDADRAYEQSLLEKIDHAESLLEEFAKLPIACPAHDNLWLRVTAFLNGRTNTGER